MSNVVLVYMTARNRRQALSIGRTLVEERLSACINILGVITSIYRWKDRLHQDGEIAFLAKTTTSKLSALQKRVASLHTYEVPCVVALPVKGGHPVFLDWVEQQVASPGSVRRAGRSGSGSKAAARRR